MIINTGGNINFDSNFFKNYKDLKSKFKFDYDNNMYYQMGLNVLLSMFEYDDEIFRPEMFDMILHDTGVCALIDTDVSKYTPVICNLVGGDRYPDGLFKNAVCFDMTGREYNFNDWRNNNEILVFFNNYTMTGDNFLDKYAYMLAETDVSITSNVIFSRLKPVPVARDKQTKNQIDAVFRDLINGELKTVLVDSGIRDLIGDGSPTIETLNVTDVRNSEYIQYLSHLHDNIISRLFFMMGLSIDDNGKQAQISIDELNRNKSASIAITNAWYNCRKYGFDIAQEKTGKKFHFRFSDVWNTEIEKNVDSEMENGVDANIETGDNDEKNN